MQGRGKAKPRFRAQKLTFVFGSYVLDVGRRELRRGHTAVSIQPQVFDLLEYRL
jgi:DNA-binding winged helix-turn-helix (wHTH) protein